MYQRVKDDLPRTNNAIEGWHHAFATDIDSNTTVPKLAQKFQHEQHLCHIKRHRHMNGIDRPKGAVKYIKLTNSIKNLIGKFDRNIISGMMYLEAIARLMKINHPKNKK